MKNKIKSGQNTSGIIGQGLLDRAQQMVKESEQKKPTVAPQPPQPPP